MPRTCLLWSETADPPSRWVGGGPSAKRPWELGAVGTDFPKQSHCLGVVMLHLSPFAADRFWDEQSTHARIAAMKERVERLPKLARGIIFRRHTAVVGAERLMLSGMASLSIPHRGAKLVLEDRVRLGRHVKFYLDSSEACIEIGARSAINRRTELCARSRIKIGKDCAIGWDVCITDSDYHEFEGAVRDAPVEIGDHVWIGARATILKGVTIGHGAVIAAGAVITQDVPERALIVGPRSQVVRENVSWQL